MKYLKKILVFFTCLAIILLFAILSTSLTPIASADLGKDSAQNLASSSCPNPILTSASPFHTDHPNKVVFHFKLKNCNTTVAGRNYKLIPDLPGGADTKWKIEFGRNVGSDNVIKAPKGEAVSFDATIYAPDDATVAEKAVSLTAKWTDGNGKDTLGFKYIVEDECVNKNPVLSATPTTKTGKPGAKIPFLVTLDNKNVGCSAPFPDYKLSVVGGVPAGWNVDFTKADDNNISDNTLDNVKDKRDFKVKITSPNNGKDKKFTIKVVNVKKNNFSDTFDLTYNVESDPNACTGTNNKNPHFTCQNKTCVRVNTCGQNGGGCTAAGGTCGTTACTGTNNKNPHFTCSANNTCIAVNTCGQNAGGCTATGGTCENNSACVKKNPEVTITADKTWAKPGGKITYTVNVKNIDQGICTKRKMSLTRTLHNDNWKGVWDPNNSFEFNKGEVRTKKLTVTAPDQASLRTYKVTINLKNNNDAVVVTKDVDFVVDDEKPVCKSPKSQPHFECQNNSCVSVSTCAENSGGCTTAGGSCGSTTCTGSDNNPHFTCQNNTCVQVNSCGQNTDGCTTTGGSCGSTSTVPVCIQSTIPPETGAAPLQVTLHGGGEAGGTDSEIVGYQWDFENTGTWDTNISIDPVTHTYTNPGTYTPKYKIKGENGLWSNTCDYKYNVVVDSSSNSCQEEENNPYFVCQNNACVAVENACGVNSEGCASAGGSCGITPGTTALSFVIGLDSIGTTGTSRVSLFAESNKDPQHPQRNFKVEVFDQNNVLVYQTSSVVNYVAGADAANYGKFVGTVDLEDSFPTGFYTIKVSVEGYLAKQFPGTMSITKGQNNNIQLVNLVTGDIDVDNTLSILDYNLLISCSIFAKTDAQKTTCDSNPSFKTLADINDDGIIDQIDYSYFLQDYSIQNGD